MKKYNLPEERREEILKILKRDGKVTALSLSETLAVSEDTVRRDLKELENNNQLKRVHGGALPCSPIVAPFSKRRDINIKSKKKIANIAAQYIKNNQVVFVDSGTTALETVKSLPFDLKATIITTSLYVAFALEQHHNIEIILLGGKINHHDMSTNDNTTISAIKEIYADVCILGVCSIEINKGITTNNFNEIAIKKQMIENSTTIIVPVTSDKFNTIANFKISNSFDVDYIITDAKISTENKDLYKQNFVEIIEV